MRALAYLVVLGLVFYVVWRFLARNAGPKAKLGPDGTNIREPETFVVHHHGKEEGLEIAKAPIPGRDMELAEDLLPEQPLHSNRAVDPSPPEADRGRVVAFRGRTGAQSEPVPHQPVSQVSPVEGTADEEVQFTPDSAWTYPLPTHYTEEAITALVRNPRSLYVYWERSAQTDQNLLGTLGEDAYRRSTPCLRVTDVTPGADPGQITGRTWLIDLSELDDHWFVQDGIEPDHTYEVSYGRRTADGRYVVLSHSLPVHTPHESPVPDAGDTMLYQLYAKQPHSEGSPQWR